MIEENQQHHWIQHIQCYKEQLEFFQFQKRSKFVGQRNVCLKLNILVFLIKSCKQIFSKPDVIKENQQYHWIQHVKFYKEQLKFHQLQKS